MFGRESMKNNRPFQNSKSEKMTKSPQSRGNSQNTKTLKIQCNNRPQTAKPERNDSQDYKLNIKKEDFSNKISKKVKTYSTKPKTQDDDEKLKISSFLNKEMTETEKETLVKKVPLVMACPTLCGNDKLISWAHRKCKSKTFLRGDGFLTDNGCGHTFHICDAKFNCGEHHDNEYLKPDFNSLVMALGTAMFSVDGSELDDEKKLLFLATVQKSICAKNKLM